MNKTFKVLIISSIVFLLGIVFCTSVGAQNLSDAFGDKLKTVAGDGAGYKTEATPEVLIGKVIQAAISFIGVIFLILMIYGGYTWMLARGNEQQVTKAKELIMAAIIGLIIVLAAYTISYFILEKIANQTLSNSSSIPEMP